MDSKLTGAAVAADLGADAKALGQLAHEVSIEAASLRGFPLNAWSGPTSWACELALLLLHGDLEAAHGDLYDAQTDTEAAAWELAQRG